MQFKTDASNDLFWPQITSYHEMDTAK